MTLTDKGMTRQFHLFKHFPTCHTMTDIRELTITIDIRSITTYYTDIMQQRSLRHKLQINLFPHHGSSFQCFARHTFRMNLQQIKEITFAIIFTYYRIYSAPGLECISFIPSNSIYNLKKCHPDGQHFLSIINQ